MTKKLTIFCYSFVAGVAAAMIIHSDAIPVATVTTLWTLSGVCGVLFILFKKTKYAIPLLILTPAFFSSANYYRVIDISDKNHISHFVDKEFFDRTIITGTIVREPDARDFSTKLTVKPELIEKPSKSGWGVIKSSAALTGKTGLVLVTIYPSLGEFYNTVEYGDKIRMDAALLPPSDMRNPSGFDYGRYLKARGIFAVMYARRPEMIQYIGPGDTGWLTRLAIKLKRRFLLIIRKTMPYPYSAFLGGVSLGSRGGVPEKVKYEFQATGVGHVLAVSGLHVGFVHILILMICNVFRVPKKPRWFILVFGLLIFAIITGASPATKRACLMSSIGQFAFTFGGMGVRMSSAITIPVSAFIILFFDPTMLPDGSFVLSYMAVWSLVHISGPVGDFMKYLFRGWAFLVIIIWILLSTGLSVICPDIFLDKNFSVSYVILMISTIAVAKIINNKYPLKNFDFVSLPKYFVQFTYAQMAIQIGMMIPLSAFFFKMFPVSGIYANYIAIPLIGYIVQLGLIANLFELSFSSLGFSALGLKIAFIINSANYIFSKFFLDMAHFFSIRFPYPFVKTPTTTEMVLYYTAVMVIVLYKPIFYLLEGLYYQVKHVVHIPAFRRRLYLIAFVAILAGSGLYFAFAKPKNILKVTFLDAGFGSSIIIQTPKGKNILIDGGSGGGWNFGTSTILPVFSKYKIMKIDRLVLTSPEPGNIGGLPAVMGKKPVEEIWDVLDPKKYSLDMTYSEFLKALDIYDFKTNSYNERPSQMFVDYYEFLRAVKTNSNKNLSKKHYRAKKGNVLYSEPGLTISALWPPDKLYKLSGDVLDNNSLVLKITYGSISFLLPSNIKRDAEWFLAETAPADLKSTVLLAPSHGDKNASTDSFIRAVAPEVVVLQYGYQKGKSFYESDLKTALEKYTARVKDGNCYRTDKSGAVTVTTDGKSYSVHSQLKKTGFGLPPKKSDSGYSEMLNVGLE